VAITAWIGVNRLAVSLDVGPQGVKLALVIGCFGRPMGEIGRDTGFSFRRG
jgi:hypothetical protein